MMAGAPVCVKLMKTRFILPVKSDAMVKVTVRFWMASEVACSRCVGTSLSVSTHTV